MAPATAPELRPRDRSLARCVGGEREIDPRRRAGRIVERELESRRKDPDHRDRRAVQLDRLSHERRIRAIPSLPDVVAEDDGRSAVQAILFLGEIAPDDGRYAEHRKHFPVDVRRAYSLRLVAVGEVVCTIAVESNVGKRRNVGLPSLVLVVGEPRLVEPLPRTPEDGDAVCFLVGERREEHALDHRKERSRGADAKGEREDHERGERRLTAQGTPGEARIPGGVGEEGSHERFDLRDVTRVWEWDEMAPTGDRSPDASALLVHRTQHLDGACLPSTPPDPPGGAWPPMPPPPPPPAGAGPPDERRDARTSAPAAGPTRP